jgi:hypothetical protein
MDNRDSKDNKDKLTALPSTALHGCAERRSDETAAQTNGSSVHRESESECVAL